MPPTLCQRILRPFGALLYRLLRPTLAEVWDECVSEGEASGYLGASAALELEGRNPYRQEQP